MAKWFLKNHDFIHVNSSMAGKYNKHKQDGSHLGFPIRMILATVDLQVTSILPMNFESIALSVQEKKIKTDFQDGCHGRARLEATMCSMTLHKIQIKDIGL